MGAALFAVAARRGRLRLTRSVMGWYAAVVLLHWLWDASRGVAVWLTLVLTGTPVQWLLVEAGRAPAATLAQVHLFTTLSWVLLAADGLVGGLLLLRARRRGVPRAERY